MHDNIVLEKSKDFAIRIIKLYQFLTDKKHEYVISKQIVRSGTSIGANLSEAMYGVSRNDFIAKVFISLKETAETEYWLELLNKTGFLSDAEYSSIDNDCKELIRLLTSIAKTARQHATKE